MALVSYINPLSEEGRNIVRGLGGLEEIFNHNDALMDIVIHTNRQTISNQEVVPDTLVDLAINRIKWYIERKNNKEFNPNDYNYFFNERIVTFADQQTIQSRVRGILTEVHLWNDSVVAEF